MSRPLRHFLPEHLYFVTSRCFQARLLLRPDPELTEIVGATLAAALERYPVRLYGFIACGNHVHMLVSGSAPHIAELCGYLFGVLARRVNALRGRTGKLWHRRYSAEPVLDDEAALRKLAYLYANPVNDNLVARCSDWPGFSTLPESLGHAPRTFTWRRKGALERARIRDPHADPADFETSHTLVVHPLPHFAGVPAAERIERLRSVLDGVEDEARRRRRTEGRRLMPRRTLLNCDPESAPRRSKRSPRPLCHASTARGFFDYLRVYRAFADAFRLASRAFRAGELGVAFPRFAFPPPLPAFVT